MLLLQHSRRKSFFHLGDDFVMQIWFFLYSRTWHWSTFHTHTQFLCDWQKVMNFVEIDKCCRRGHRRGKKSKIKFSRAFLLRMNFTKNLKLHEFTFHSTRCIIKTSYNEHKVIKRSTASTTKCVKKNPRAFIEKYFESFRNWITNEAFVAQRRMTLKTRCHVHKIRDFWQANQVIVVIEFTWN